MAKKDYSNYSKEELIKIVHKLEKKRYGLVWEDKPELLAQECKTKLPVITEEKSKEIVTNKDEPTNIFIEGDNYHSLWTLNYSHKKKIDVIYLDPPYNTGSRSWKYNNDFVEKDDSFRHSKWLSFMYKRLVLAKNLLKNDGFIIISIDHYELFYLGAICDEIFREENRIGIVTVVHKPEGRNQEKFFGTSNEYMLFYAKNKDRCNFRNSILDEEIQVKFDEEDEVGKYRLKNFIRLTDGKYSLRENKPHFYYPVYVSPDLTEISIIKIEGFEEVFPITKKGVERTWKTTDKTLLKRASAGEIVAKQDDTGRIDLFEKLRENQVIKTHWIKKEYHAYHFGTKLLKSILCSKVFEFPKSLYLLIDTLKITAKKDAIVLDFFAGSGTTGHAVLELNKEDGGKRKFILCTNNENNNGNGFNGIAEDICYPRMKKVIEGYKNSDGKENQGLGSNLKYYKTDFVPFAYTDSDKRELTNKSTEVLCLAEETYDKILVRQGEFSLFENSSKITAIIYGEDFIEDCKNEIKKLNKTITIYVFSYDKEYNPEDFADLEGKIKIKPIPEAILNVYRKIGRK